MVEELRVETTADRVARGLVRQWVWLLNGIMLIYAGLPWLSPLLRSWDYERAGLAIYRTYTMFCHQFTERTFFWRGYPVCYCHRCTALYTGILGFGLIYGLARWRWAISHRMLVLLILPMLIDGTWHLLDDMIAAPLRSADSSVGSLNFWLRMITGLLCAAGVILWGYPRLQRTVDEADLTA